MRISDWSSDVCSSDLRDLLVAAYRYLRRLENRLQMLRDAQVHALPDDANDRIRIAAGLAYPDWPAPRTQLDAVRGQGATAFDALVAPPEIGKAWGQERGGTAG